MKKLKIEYEDKSILIVDKPYKKLTVSDGTRTNTLYSVGDTIKFKKY